MGTDYLENNRYSLSNGDLYMRKMILEDVKFTQLLRGDKDTYKWFFSKQKPTLESTTKWFLSHDPQVHWDCVAIQKDKRVGYVSMYNINWAEKDAEWGSWTILPEYRGGDVAFQMGTILMLMAKEYGIKLLYSEIMADNIRSIKACEKLGCKWEILPGGAKGRITINPQQVSNSLYHLVKTTQ